MAGASLLELCPSPRRVQATLARARRPLERTEPAYGRPSGGVLGAPTGATAAVSRGPRPFSGARVVEALFDRADAGAQAQAAEALPVHPLPDRWESVSPSGAGQDPPEAPGDASVAVLEDTLRHGAVSPSTLAQLWEGATGAILLAFILDYHGLSLEVIGRFFDVHKTTVMRWLSPLAQINWQAAVFQGTRLFS